jgi:hypothetical protein
MVNKEEPPPNETQETQMLIAIITTFLLTAGLGLAFAPTSGETLIARRPYNNRYSDATGAREDHLA